MKKRININTELRAHRTPTAEDPRCARMTTYSIPLCSNTTEGIKKYGRDNYYTPNKYIYPSLRSQTSPSRAEIPDQVRYDEESNDYYPITIAQIITPQAEDPRCARMTNYGIPLCTRITNETKKQADMLTYNKKKKKLADMLT